MGCRTRIAEQIIEQIIDQDGDYVLALKGNQETLAIENSLQWGLDVSFLKDACRVRKANACENLAVLRHIAITLLKQDPAKLGIRTKGLKAGWSESYVAQLLLQPPKLHKGKPASENPNIHEA